MKLLTQQLLHRFEEVGRQDLPDPLLIAKFFAPYAGWTWYPTEYDSEEGIFFGYVMGSENEWGYFSLSELESVVGPLGLGIERDLHFEEHRFSELNP